LIGDSDRPMSFSAAPSSTDPDGKAGPQKPNSAKKFTSATSAPWFWHAGEAFLQQDGLNRRLAHLHKS
jgi:hypothetical protein